MHWLKRFIAVNRIKNRTWNAIQRDRKEIKNMRKERVSANVDRQTKLRIKKSAEALGISESHLIAQAVETDLDKLDIRLQTHEARKQRDHFKAKFDTALSDLRTAEAKIEALKNRGLFARIFNRPL